MISKQKIGTILALQDNYTKELLQFARVKEYSEKNLGMEVEIIKIKRKLVGVIPNQGEYDFFKDFINFFPPIGKIIGENYFRRPTIEQLQVFSKQYNRNFEDFVFFLDPVYLVTPGIEIVDKTSYARVFKTEKRYPKLKNTESSDSDISPLSYKFGDVLYEVIYIGEQYKSYILGKSYLDVYTSKYDSNKRYMCIDFIDNKDLYTKEERKYITEK